MDCRPQREALRAELEKQGLPRAYINRLLDELDDHFSDLADDLVSTEGNRDMSAARMPDFRVSELDQRMGSPTELAIFAAEQYRARSFWGRHPILTFLFGPLQLLVAIWAAVLIAIWIILFAIDGICYVLEHALGIPLSSVDPADHPWLQAITVALVSWIIIVLPPLTSAWLLCRVAARNALSWRWPTAACILLALVAAIIMVSFDLRTAGQDGRLMVGFDVGSSISWFVLKFLPKLALAMGIGLALVWREERRDRGEISDNSATISTLPAA